MAFEVASTNLVLELSIIMAVPLGWQFTVAELSGRFAGIAPQRSVVLAGLGD
jgi:hypothetical protein